MDTTAGEVTLYDLIAWEPEISIAAASRHTSLTRQEVDWVLTARPTQPMLPKLRGGELIILPNRIVRETGVPFNQLVRELGMQPIAGVLTDVEGPLEPGEVTVLRIPTLGAETEALLNRLIATGRRQAQNAIAELDQSIAEAAARQSRPSELVDLLARRLKLPISIHTGGGAVLFTTGSGRDEPDPSSDAWLHAPFRSGHTLWLGPIPPDLHAIARFGITHVRDSLQRSLDSTHIAAPRGTARAAALSTLLQHTEPARLAQAALDAGVPAGYPLRVARSANVPAATVLRSLGHFGDVLDASNDGEEEIWLIVERPDRAQPPFRGSIGSGWIVVSSQVSGPAQLPLAVRQAQFTAIARQRRILTQPLIEFGPSLGIYALLFEGWGSERHREYCDQHLGELLRNDPRGQLVETLAAYLDHQGSQGLAADALSIHRNTLSYRLRQIEALLPGNLADASVRLTLHVAIAIHRLSSL